MQWTALLSALTGAVIATGSTAFLDRVRWRRDKRERTDEVRRQLYGEYLACLSEARNAFRSLARNHDLAPGAKATAARDAFAACYALRYQMSITASSAVFDASKDTFRKLRDVRDTTAQGAGADDQAYAAGRTQYENSLHALRRAMRKDLGISMTA
ncbi:hypothetical protein AB0J38_02150 [Streptomyces sp. NPDC050095]|uniref:hypothetical protein n=1 Tax=unclassified Streptomyces TaxID=2593676 RepID=UPI003436E63D